MKKLLVLFLTLYVNVFTAQESVVLRMNYEKGAVYENTMTIKQEMGAAMSMGMTIIVDSKIVDVQGDSYESEMKFTKMTMDMLQGGNVLSYDSTKSDDELDAGGKMMKMQVAPMLKAVMYAKGNDRGEVNEIRVEPNVPGMEDMANQSSSVVYPEEAVKVGSTWTMEKEEKGMKMNFIYTVKEITEDKVIVVVSGDVGGMATGKIKGNLEIEKSSGLPLDSKIDMEMNVNGQEVASKVTMKMTKK
ncbi:DUF6263 family protein [Polaribacter sp.]|uniref:DUF6263 family protein n=1 Tax=Polaribacter sp. TaxID=1920175 RepID=UPI003F6BDEEC